jgi:DNA-binding transcriptional ArsR family regulator
MTYVSALAALSDPTRRAVFERLRAGPASVREIADGLPVSRPAVSQHLKALREAGLVRDEPRGTARIYSIHRPGLRDLRDWVDSFWDEALENFRKHAEEQP